MHLPKMTRRRLLATSGPAAALAGAALTGRSAFAQDGTPPADDGGLVDISAPSTPEAGATGELSGTITIALGSNDTQTYQALADAYMALNPGVTVAVELKPGEGYQEFIRSQFAAGTPEVSVVGANVVADLLAAKKFLDLSAYLDKTNPYTGAPWRDSMDETAVANMVDPTTSEMFVLNLETVQVLWFYNESAFEAAGILEEARALAETEKNQPTWSQFMGWCDKLTAAGYIPVAIEGDYTLLLGDAASVGSPGCTSTSTPATRPNSSAPSPATGTSAPASTMPGSTTRPTPTTTTPPRSRSTPSAR